MKSPLPLVVLAVFSVVLFAVIFSISLPKVVIPVFQTAFLPKAEERIVPPITPPPLTLHFTGDIMLARLVEATIKQKGVDWPFQHLGPLFSEADFVIGNFE